jgi:hypothetical protein
MAKRTEKKSASTERLLLFYDTAMTMCNLKDGTRCHYDDVVEAIKSANFENEDTILRTLRRWRPRKIKD